MRNLPVAGKLLAIITTEDTSRGQFFSELSPGAVQPYLGRREG